MTKSTKPPIYEVTTDRIVEALEAGTIPWTRPWKTTSPRNAETKREYRGINKVLLWLIAQENNYSSTGWVTYRQAHSLGGHVRRGEKASPVIWWSQAEAKRTVESEDDEQPSKFWIARCYHVFNLDQVAGVDSLRASLDQPDFDFHPLYKCERMVEEYGADIRHVGDEAFYSPSGDFIQLPVPQSFTSRESYYATLAHELIHHSGAAHRLNRNINGRFGSEAYAREELVAELGSAFLTAELGIPHETRASAAYISSWLHTLRSDKKAIFEAAKLAQAATDYVLNRSENAATTGQFTSTL